MKEGILAEARQRNAQLIVQRKFPEFIVLQPNKREANIHLIIRCSNYRDIHGVKQQVMAFCRDLYRRSLCIRVYHEDEWAKEKQGLIAQYTETTVDP